MTSRQLVRAVVAVLFAIITLTSCGRKPMPESPVKDATQDSSSSRSRDASDAGARRDGRKDDEATADNPTGFATLSGAFKLVGEAPPNPILPISKDQHVCAPGGMEVRAQQLVVGPDAGIANILIYADRVPATWVHDSAKPGKTDEVIFDQKKCVFLSHVLAMQASQTLKILNSDRVGHNTKFEPRNSSPFNQIIPVNGSASYQPAGEEREPFAVSCNVHPWMRAWIITRETSYFSITDEEGKFEVPNLPSGVPLRFRVWHEKARFRGAVTVNGKAEKWVRRRFTLTLNPDENRQLNVEVDALEFQ